MDARVQRIFHELADFDRTKQPDDWERFRAESVLGASLARQKKYAAAEPLLLEGYQGMVSRKKLTDAANGYYLDRARGWTEQLYRAQNKPVQAAAWRQK